jgi:outer membrane protein TolC
MQGRMRVYLIGISFCVVLLTCFSVANGQSKKSDDVIYFNPITDNITDRLPPLRVLVDSASFNSPSAKYEDLKATYYSYEQVSAAREWLEYLSINLDAVVGRWDYRDKDEFSRSDRYYLSESYRTTFAGMFYIRMPLGALFDRRNRINKQKKWIEISLVQKEINLRYLQERVIIVYNDLVEAQSLIRIYNDYQTFTMMQMTMAQNEFLNGEISTAEYTRLKEIQTSGATRFQQAIANFNKNYQTLEVITGMNFNLITVLR